MDEGTSSNDLEYKYLAQVALAASGPPFECEGSGAVAHSMYQGQGADPTPEIQGA